MASKLEPQALLLLLQQRDSKGYSVLYDQYGKTLFGIICKIVTEEEEAANLLQDTFVKIWRKIDDYDATKGTLFTWMLNIARNTSIDYLRSKNFLQQSQNQMLDDYVSIEISRDNTIPVEHIGLRDLVEKLEPAYREVIDLVYFVGFTQEEAAEKLKIPLGTLKSRSRIAMRELRKWI